MTPLLLALALWPLAAAAIALAVAREVRLRDAEQPPQVIPAPRRKDAAPECSTPSR